MSVRQLSQPLDILFFDATSLLRTGELGGTMRVSHLWGAPTCSQSAICVFNWFTCFMRPFRTSTACAGETACYTRCKSKLVVGGLEAAHQHRWVFFALELHGDCGDGRTITGCRLNGCAQEYSCVKLERCRRRSSSRRYVMRLGLEG